MLQARLPRPEHTAKATREDLHDPVAISRLNVNIPRPLLGELKKLAFSEGVSMTDLVTALIVERLERVGKGRAV